MGIGKHKLSLTMSDKKAFLSIKYYQDNINRQLIEDICEALAKAGLIVSVVVRDIEHWGETNLPAQELMKQSFDLIDMSKIIFVESSEKGMGIGIEAGYAFATGKFIIVIAQEGIEISNSLRGIADTILYYKHPEDLTTLLKYSELF